ncbi:hypothetical protein MNBD_GAMMA07-144 [hydrothermal vent metagenome]|uniref:TIGR02449 family protein n=1 Tax=hydrothermal vent metagenome TaxID=652676 RepID=A0A3B0X2H7_9ZZZZ
MNTENQSNIEALEDKIEDLLANYQSLAAENVELKQQLQDIRNDRAHLFEQREQVRSQVEGMITRLKIIESG